MNIDELKRCAENLRQYAGLAVECFPDADPEGLHILQINRVDFFFYANGAGCHDWEQQIIPPNAAS